MMIKDLERTQDLARDELCAVRGGSNFGSVGGQQANQVVVAGGGVFSPTTAVNAAVNAPSLTQVDNHAFTAVDIDSNNVVASTNTLIGSLRPKAL
jgi:hypothetical protein